jgi:SAM-dependent methyltransferase
MRVAKASRYVPRGARILDVGCSDGPLFQHLEGRIAGGVGIDPDLDGPIDRGSYRLLGGRFPDDLTEPEAFDAVTMLAVLEHIPPETKASVAAACAARLKPGGRLIITVPSARVDRILDILRKLRLIHGMALEEHHGFDVEETRSLFEGSGLRFVRRERFQFGLNNLFVFEKPIPVS